MRVAFKPRPPPLHHDARMRTILLISLLSAAPVLVHGDQGVSSSAGGGHYTVVSASGDLAEMQFGYSAIVHKNGRATGQFHHAGSFQGFTIEFHADVTCVAIDAALNRAWIGGVITVNRSTHPTYRDATITQPGHDIWFRVLDAGNGGSGDPDRTTFVGFEGVIPSSEAYCRDRPWRSDNIWAVTGNVTINP
jgi:hypothetical protein